jgi:DNA-binding SARP family transcriptional activator
VVHIGVLGPLEVSTNGHLVEISGLMLRRLLVLFVSRPGVPIDADALAEQLWQGCPPRTSRKTVAVYVHRLRRTLGSDELISFGPAGYTFIADGVGVDAVTFDQLAQQALSGPAPDRDMIARALALWRGPAFQGFADMPTVEQAAQRMSEMRAGLLEQHFELALEAGQHTEIAGAVREAIAEFPYRERLYAHLMVALYRSGRRVEALEVYRDVYRLLTNDLGVEPMADLQRLHTRILNSDAALALERVETAGVPAQLPAAIVDFTGRSGQLSEMDAWAAGPRTAPLLVTGGAGLGKTSLAIHWGSRYAATTGAGHLYLNLRGHSADPPLRPIDALSYFLRSLGAAPEQIPVDVVEAAALFRSRVAPLHLLVVIDNAASAEQVRPLLPGGPANLVIITSRERLSGLVARDSARRISLDGFTDSEAVELLGRMIGTDRVGQESDSARTLARLCGYQPLALRVAAANLTGGAYRSIAALVDDITDATWPRPFDLVDEPDAGPRAALDHSYGRLEPDHQRLFRLLSAVPGPDFTLTAADSLTGDHEGDVERALQRLANAHLVEQQRPGRFSLHDLIQRYAWTASMETDEPAVRQTALNGLLRYYLRSCDAAATVAYPQVIRLEWTEPDGSGPAESFEEHAGAIEWLDDERANLIAAIKAAVDSGDATSACLLADMMRGYFSIRRLRSEWLEVSDIALSTAERTGDVRAQIAGRLSASMVRWALGAYSEAASILLVNVDLARDVGWIDAAVSSLTNLGGIYGEWGRLPDAAACLEEALELHPAGGRPTTTASILTNLGAVSCDLGRLDASIKYATDAMRLFDEIGVPLGAARTEQNLGESLLAKGEIAKARTHLESALSRLDGMGDRHAEASVLVNLALLRYEQGDLAGARDAAQKAKGLSEQIAARILTANALSALALIDREPRLHREAIEILCESKAARQETEARLNLAATLLECGDLGEAQGMCEEAISGSRAGGYRHVEASGLAILARIHQRCGRREMARATAGEALAKLEETGCLRYRAELGQILSD